MNHTSLMRRLSVGVIGLTIGLGGTLTIAAPAQAQQDSPRTVVDCQWHTFTVRHDGETAHPWRAVLQPPDAALEDRIVWQSGDWPADADLGDDPSEWDDGWARKGNFEVVAGVEDAPNGPIVVQWWDHQAGSPGWKPYTIGGQWEWPYERPCGWVGSIEVTQPTCENPLGVIVIPGRDPADDKGTDNLTYWINGVEAAPGPHEVPPGTYEVTALRIGGVKNYTKKWTVVIAPPDCPEPSPTPSPAPPAEENGEGGGLPVTGSSTTLIAGGAVALLVLGGGLYLLARRRRVTFTA